MWLYFTAFILLIVGIIGSFFSGGIFTILFIPLGVVLVLVAGGSSVLAARAKHTGRERAPAQPLPTHAPADTGHPLSTPGDLVDARQRAQ